MKKNVCIMITIITLASTAFVVKPGTTLVAAPGGVSVVDIFTRLREVLEYSAQRYFRVEESVYASLIAPPLPLINANNMLERDFRPEKMIDISQYVRSQRSPLWLDEAAGNAFISMVSSMHEYGITNMAAISGFRDWDHQYTLHNNQINRFAQRMPLGEARIQAATVVAPPGASEHQSGLAIDVSSACIGFALSERFENTDSFRWLASNAHMYGFIIRYPRDSMEITGVIFEPWHLRYVGSEHASRIFESGLVLEEYLEEYGRGAWSE